MNSRLIRRGTALLLALIALRATHIVAQDAISPFVVGVWGQGDAIIPFADFDGRSWRSSWPAPNEIAPDLLPLQRLPAAWWGRSTFEPTWELVEPNGRRRNVQITGTGFARMGSGCSINIALKTDVPANTYNYGTVLAANRAGVIDPVQALTSDAVEWRAVSALLSAFYQRHEAAAWKEVPEGFRPDMTGRPPSPRLAAAFISIDADGQYLYFESYREFPLRPDQLGSERSFITGWLWRRTPSSPFQAVAIRAATTDEDHKSEPTFHPRGAVRHAAQRFWLGTLSAYVSSALAVFDVRRNGIKQLVIAEYPGC
jgi:hypothetical protein